MGIFAFIVYALMAYGLYVTIPERYNRYKNEKENRKKEHQEQVASTLANAKERMQEKDYPAAIEGFKKVKEMTGWLGSSEVIPHLRESLILYGDDLVCKKEYKSAIDAFSEASNYPISEEAILADKKKTDETYMIWGIESLKNERYDEAVEAYQVIVRAYGTPENWLNLGLAYRGAGLTDDARSAFTQSINAYKTKSQYSEAGKVQVLLNDLQMKAPIAQPVHIGVHAIDEGVQVSRGYERTGEWIKLGVKVTNNTDLVINSVTVQIDEYPSGLQYELQEKKAVIELKRINPGELQSAIFRFRPKRCVDGKLTGYVRYTDAKGKKHTIDIRPVDVKSVCPMLTSDGVTESEILEKLMDEHLNCNKTFIEFEGSVRSVFDVVQARLGRLILYDHDWRVSESAYIGHLFYLGKTKYAKKYFAAEFLLSGTSEDKGGLTISVYSDEPAILTGFFQEIVSDLENHITVLKESSEVCGIGCGKCGGPLDIETAADGGYVKCDHCDFWNRIPKWKRRTDEGS